MADKGLSITPCNNAAIRQDGRDVGQLDDAALAPVALAFTHRLRSKPSIGWIALLCGTWQLRWSWIFRR